MEEKHTAKHMMVAEKQQPKIEDSWNQNQAKRAAGERGLSVVKEFSEVVERCFKQLSYTAEAEKDGDTLQDEEEDVEEMCLMSGQSLPESSQDTQSESLLGTVEIPEQATKELANNKKDLNFQQKAFNWLNEKVKKRTLQKIERTYQREAEEESEPYLSLVRCMASMRDIPLPTRAARERAKREKLMLFEEQRQKFEDRWNRKQAQRAEQKEARKVKEEERCHERWAVRRRLNQNIVDDIAKDRVETSGSTTAKKPMTMWKKRFLRFNCLTG